MGSRKRQLYVCWLRVWVSWCCSLEWQPQPEACMMIGMLALSRVRKFMKLRGLLGSVLKGFFAFGSFFVWEGESLLAGNSPAGIVEQATGRVDVPGEKQIVAAAAAAAAASCASPVVKVETDTWQVLVRTLTGRSVALQVSNSLSRHCLDCLLAERVGVPVGSFYVLRNARVWRNEVGLQRENALRMAGRLLGGTRPPPVFIPGQWTCSSCGMEGCWPSKNAVLSVLGSTSCGNGADSSRQSLGRASAGEIISWSACCESEPDESDFSAFALRRCSGHQCLRVLLPRRHSRWRICLTPRRSLRCSVCLLVWASRTCCCNRLRAGIPSACCQQTEECWAGETTADYYW